MRNIISKFFFTLLLLAMSIGNAWATDVTLFNVDFSAQTNEDITTTESNATFVAKTYSGYNMSMGIKSGKPIKIVDAGLEFTSNNYANYTCLAIPLTLTANNKVTATITLTASGKVKYNWVSGSLPSTPNAGSGNTYGTNGTTNTLEFTPTSAGNYVLYLGKSGSDSGKTIKSIVITQAASSGDVTAPTLSSSNPANNATNVAVSGNIVLTFSENVTVNDASKFSITGGVGSITTASISVSGAAVTIPYTGLANNTTYTFSTAADAVKDASNNKNAALSDISFTTVAAGPVDPTLTYSEGAYTVGGSALDLSSLITSSNSSGAITYEVKTDGDTHATIDGNNFSATDAGTCIVTASQAEVTGTFNAIAVDFNVVVSAGAPAPTPCATLTPATSGEAPAANDQISLQTGSTGGSIKALTANLSYTANGLLFGNNSSTKAEVTLNHLMQVGTVITATIYNDNNDKNRGLNLLNSNGTSKATWTKNMIGDHVETYTVVAGDGLAGSNVFQLQRNNNAYLKSLTVSNCGAELHELTSAVDPVHDPAYATVTLSKSMIAEGSTATATYSDIDSEYEFDEWQISGTGATLSSSSTNPTTVTMGSADAIVTLKLKEKAGFAVTYKANNGTEEADVVVAKESVFAANMFTAPEGKIFNGWNTSATGEGASYAVGAAVPAATTVFAQWIDDPTIRLILQSGETYSINTEKFEVYTGTELDGTAYTVQGTAFAKNFKFGNTGSAIAGQAWANKFMAYDVTTNSTDIKLYLYNKNSNSKNLYYQIIYEGAAAGELQTVEVTSKGSGQILNIPTINATKGARVVFYVNSTDVRICQMEVRENGTALPAFGAAGYEFSIPGRAATYNNNGTFDGFTIKSYSEVKFISGISYLALRGIDASSYVTFTTASNIQLQVTTANANKFYVCAANIGTSADKQYGGEAGTHNVNLLAGTYYIVPTAGSSGGEVQITKLAFATAPATVTVTFNSNEGSAVAAQELFSGDKAVEPTAPTKSGYRFVEWQLSGSAYDFDDAVTTDIELDAVWQKTWTVTFDSDGGSAVAAATVDDGQAVAKPADPTKDGFDFVEWQLNSATYNFASAVEANITLVATWEVAQDDASLSALSYSGNAIDVASAEDVSGVQTYTVHLPWGSTIDAALISVTKSAESADMSAITYDSENKRASFMVTSGNGLVSINYAIQFVIDAKHGTSIVKAVISGGDQKAGFTATGIYGDKGYAYTRSNKKMDTSGKYVGVKLLSGKTFAAGDKLYVVTSTAADLGYIEIYEEAEGTNLIKATGVRDASEGIEVAELAGYSEFYIVRKASEGDQAWNGFVDYIEVTREMAPAIKSFKFGDDAATINEGAKTITIEVPFSTDVTALTPTVEAYGNNGATYTPSGAQDFTSPVDYVVTDAYSELSTTYAVTVTKAPASENANLASLAVAGYSLDFDPATTSYNIVLDYGTTVLPAITYEVEEVGLATAEKVEGGVNGATTITVTPEAGAGYEKVYTINFSVSTNPKYVIYDGSTMTNIASATGSDVSTGFSYSLASNIPLSGDAISSSWGGKDYTHAIKGFKPNDNSSNIVSFVIPEGYVAKVRLVGSTNSDTKERKLFIAMSASKDAADALDNYIITSSTYDAQGFVTDYLLPNTYYLGSTDSYRLFEFSIQLYPIDYSRNVTEGRFGTICLPNGGVLLGADLYEVAYYGETSKKIFFDEILSGVMEAGVPYVFLPQEGVNKLAVVYTDDADAAATNRNGLVGFIGTDADDEIPVPEGMYILQNNQYREVLAGADARIKSYRAYINLGAITPTAPALAPGRRRISMGVASENSATGMDELNASETPVKMMIDGQLYILRGEKLYDATGRLVK